MRIIMMGTPQFAVPMLKALHEHHALIGVVTQIDRPRGRKHTPVPPPVKVEAQALGIPVYQFSKIRQEEPSCLLEALHADVIVTAAYGQILTKRHLQSAPYGVINAHASRLPAYRGPAPVNRCLMAGETKTGVTVMHTDVGIDDGDIILERTIDILPNETAGELLIRLAPLAADAMLEALSLLEHGEAPRIPQDDKKASYHPMLKKADGFLPFTKSAKEVCDHARGVTPWPGACARLNGEVFKFDGLLLTNGQGEPGNILCADEKHGLIVACGEGAVSMNSVQAPGKRMMAASDFLRGRIDLYGKRFLA